MQFRRLGKTGIQISVIAFGGGPISTLMVGDDLGQQRNVIRAALDAGINWFDTAATYGNGQSEQNIGRALQEIGGSYQSHIATKVRLTVEDLANIPQAVYRSVTASLHRLKQSQVSLLQLHNSITQRRGDEPTSISSSDVLGRFGVLEAFQKLRDDGLVQFLGLTGIGEPKAMAEVVRSGQFDTIQVPYHLLNASAGCTVSDDFGETNYGNIIRECAQHEMGVLAIRVLAGGALADNNPSPHTLKTPFFPLALYERDRARAALLRQQMGSDFNLQQVAIRFALEHPSIHSAIIGFAETHQIDEALAALQLPHLPRFVQCFYEP